MQWQPLALVIALLSCIWPMAIEEAEAKAKFDKDKLFVYIECQTANGPVRSGSGVIVSDRGAVLTARHVVLGADKQGLARKLSSAEMSQVVCRGEIGTGGKAPSLKLTLGRADDHYDAMLLQLPRLPGKDKFDYARYVRVPSSLATPDVTAYGVPGGSTTGEIEERSGRITATQAKSDGTIPTDALTVAGMSGGPVIYNANGGLIGIVIGVRTQDGLAADYKILAAEKIARALELVELSKEAVANGQSERSAPATAATNTYMKSGRNFIVELEGCGFQTGVVECTFWATGQATTFTVHLDRNLSSVYDNAGAFFPCSRIVVGKEFKSCGARGGGHFVPIPGGVRTRIVIGFDVPGAQSDYAGVMFVPWRQDSAVRFSSIRWN